MWSVKPSIRLFLSIFLALSVCPISAQEIQTTSLTVAVPRLSALTISGDVSGLLTLSVDATGETAFDAGFIESAADATMLTLSTNDTWDLNAKLNGEWSCPGAYDKPEDDLTIKITNTPTGTIQNGAGAYITLSATDTEILSHDSAVTGNEVDIQTKVLLDWTNDIPGSYSISLTYTLTTHLP
ncbi:MAG: hypothetical protein KJ970_19250 [Candidatus Eisenbacteria bacterium]|uniref:DUF4402 domain-containing protein n=1 Tax=Eiseniibacteriota bacterium TaxID=2212470 RepID=A0A948S0G7_UNCEI|nr:hypothetical protein [Candidatus Eisenbacteria bacterium]MBU1949722.1 hypothetical protein [Candidatus Eisenbacteria bacterium]MBU2693058.1 hypothetical protein [Candidatus Eisenbacteria bacterium]